MYILYIILPVNTLYVIYITYKVWFLVVRQTNVDSQRAPVLRLVFVYSHKPTFCYRLIVNMHLQKSNIAYNGVFLNLIRPPFSLVRRVGPEDPLGRNSEETINPPHMRVLFPLCKPCANINARINAAQNGH